jgi:membrane protease YdiL (CAAX protease family)
MVAFALTAHDRRMALARHAAAACAAASLALGMMRAKQPLVLIMGDRPRLSVLPMHLLALAPWIACAVYYRHYLRVDGLLPTRLAGFAVLAAAIGGAEEVAYRGYVQGSLRHLGATVSIIGAALAHTAYKVALFVFPPAHLNVDLVWLGLYTFAGGLVLGGTRQWSRGIAAPLACHVVFDVIVYGDRTTIPPWV